MTSQFKIFFLTLILSTRLYAEEIPNPEIDKYFLILKSTKEYSEAKTTAIEASEKLKTRLDLRNLVFNSKSGLTYDKKTCMEGPIQEFPCYNPRGKFDDGEYVSIEYSDGYNIMKPGLYVVIAFSGDKKEAETSLKKFKPFYKDAYIKSVKIYMAGE